MSTSSSNDSRADSLVREADRANGMIPVDTETFWEQWERDARDPFAAECVPIGPLWSAECVFDELGEAEDWYRYYHDPEWLADRVHRYNDVAQQIVGRRLLAEGDSKPLPWHPVPRTLADLFEAENVFHHESYWLMRSAEGPEELAALLDRVEERLECLRAFMLPSGWDEAKERLPASGVRVPQYTGQRGPVTFATSIYGIEDLCCLLIEEPELAERFRDVILRSMLGMRRVLEQEARSVGQEHARGFSFADDNCYLLSPQLYEFFGAPILKGVFEHCASEPDDWRYQHSDSAMGHLLPILARFNLKEVNFGPTVPTEQIREHMPNTVIAGQLAPFTYSRRDRTGIVRQFLRDRAAVGETKGLRFHTAGSVNNGSRLTDLRLLMAAVQRWGWY